MWASEVRVCSRTVQAQNLRRLPTHHVVNIGYPTSWYLCFPIFKLMAAVSPNSQGFESYTLENIK